MNIFRLTDDELITAFHDFNFIFGYMKAKLDSGKKKYLQEESQFKKILDEINKMATSKFEKREFLQNSKLS